MNVHKLTAIVLAVTMAIIAFGCSKKQDENPPSGHEIQTILTAAPVVTTTQQTETETNTNSIAVYDQVSENAINDLKSLKYELVDLTVNSYDDYLANTPYFDSLRKNNAYYHSSDKVTYITVAVNSKKTWEPFINGVKLVDANGNPIKNMKDQEVVQEYTDVVFEDSDSNIWHLYTLTVYDDLSSLTTNKDTDISSTTTETVAKAESGRTGNKLDNQLHIMVATDRPIKMGGVAKAIEDKVHTVVGVNPKFVSDMPQDIVNASIRRFKGTTNSLSDDIYAKYLHKINGVWYALVKSASHAGAARSSYEEDVDPKQWDLQVSSKMTIIPVTGGRSKVLFDAKTINNKVDTSECDPNTTAIITKAVDLGHRYYIEYSLYTKHTLNRNQFVPEEYKTKPEKWYKQQLMRAYIDFGANEVSKDAFEIDKKAEDIDVPEVEKSQQPDETTPNPGGFGNGTFGNGVDVQNTVVPDGDSRNPETETEVADRPFNGAAFELTVEDDGEYEELPGGYEDLPGGFELETDAPSETEQVVETTQANVESTQAAKTTTVTTAVTTSTGLNGTTTTAVTTGTGESNDTTATTGTETTVETTTTSYIPVKVKEVEIKNGKITYNDKLIRIRLLFDFRSKIN